MFAIRYLAVRKILEKIKLIERLDGVPKCCYQPTDSRGGNRPKNEKGRCGWLGYNRLCFIRIEASRNKSDGDTMLALKENFFAFTGSTN